MSRSKAKAVNVDDIWSILEKTKENPDETSDSHDVGVLIVGEPGCGKSSLLQSFLKPNVTKDPKPTFALEYNFVRKKQISTKVASKAVSHLWELGGDIFEPKMLEIPLALKTLKYTSVIICCDLSKPNNVIPSLLKWITCVTDCVQKQYNKTVSDEENSFDIQEYLKNKSQYCYGAEHPDLQKVSVGPISLYIALTKYDQFKTRNSVECRAILQAIRFIAHAHCASIITTCSVDAALRESFRSVFNQICFSGAAFGVKVGLDVQSDRPINVQAGKDSFGSILMPGSGKNDGTKLAASESDVGLYVGPNGLTKDCWVRIDDFMKNLFGERFDMIGIHKGVFQLQPKPMSCLGAGTGHGSSSTGRNTYIDYELEDEKSNGHHDGGTAFEELKNFPESEVDDMRHQKDIQLQLYMQEMALKEQLIHKMNAPSSNAKNSSTSKSIEENESKSDRENHRSRK